MIVEKVIKCTYSKIGKLINKIITQVQRKEKFDYVPTWFINLIPINLEEKYSEISDGWKTTAVIYVSANAGEAYAKLYEQFPLKVNVKNSADTVYAELQTQDYVHSAFLKQRKSLMPV